MKLFDEKQKYTNEGNELASQVGRFLDPIFERVLREGGSVRELAAIVHAEVTASMSSAILGWSLNTGKRLRITPEPELKFDVIEKQ